MVDNSHGTPPPLTSPKRNNNFLGETRGNSGKPGETQGNPGKFRETRGNPGKFRETRGNSGNPKISLIALLNKVTTTSHLRLIGVVGVGVNTTIIGIIKLLPLVNPYFLGNLEENSGKLREIRGTSGKPRETRGNWGKL